MLFSLTSLVEVKAFNLIWQHQSLSFAFVFLFRHGLVCLFSLFVWMFGKSNPNAMISMHVCSFSVHAPVNPWVPFQSRDFAQWFLFTFIIRFRYEQLLWNIMHLKTCLLVVNSNITYCIYAIIYLPVWL